MRCLRAGEQIGVKGSIISCTVGNLMMPDRFCFPPYMVLLTRLPLGWPCQTSLNHGGSKRFLACHQALIWVQSSYVDAWQRHCDTGWHAGLLQRQAPEKVSQQRGKAHLDDSFLALQVPLPLVEAPLALPQLPPEGQQLRPLSFCLVCSSSHLTLCCSSWELLLGAWASAGHQGAYIDGVHPEGRTTGACAGKAMTVRIDHGILGRSHAAGRCCWLRMLRR